MHGDHYLALGRANALSCFTLFSIELEKRLVDILNHLHVFLKLGENLAWRPLELLGYLESRLPSQTADEQLDVVLILPDFSEVAEDLGTYLPASFLGLVFLLATIFG